MVKVLFLERHFLKNILILCNLKDMHFFPIISIFLSSRENGCFTVWMPLMSIKITALNRSLFHLIEVKAFCLHIEGKRVPIIIPYPQLFTLNITGEKALS